MQQNVQARRDDMPHILVVDDDSMVCMAIDVYLERHNFQVTIADGGEAGRIFYERAPTVPLIAMSGYAFANLNSPAPDFLRMTLDLGASRCLRKPFTPVALLAVINECLSEARSRRSGTAQVG